jgi:hypothetical protein
MLSTQTCPAEYGCFLCECRGDTSRKLVHKTLYPMNTGPIRTKDSIIELANQAENERQEKINAVRQRPNFSLSAPITIDGNKYKGIKGFCALLRLPYFDVSKQCLLDPMHIIEGIWKHHIFDLMKGETKLNKPAPDDSAAVVESRIQDQLLKVWSLSQRKRDSVDALYATLQLPKGVAPRTRFPFKQTGNINYKFNYYIFNL